jgi:hypothetical protein
MRKVVPNIKESWDADIPGTPAEDGKKPRVPVAGAGQIEFEIKRQIYCELKEAVRNANYYYQRSGSDQPYKPFLPNDWGAFVSLSLQVDESSSLNPGVAFNVPMANAISTFGVVNKTAITTSTPQSFSLGFGGNLSSTATRIDKFDPYWTIAYLSKPVTDVGVCNRPPDNPDKNDPFVMQHYTPAKSSPLIVSDLGLTPWLLGALFTNNGLHSVIGSDAPDKKMLAEERKFLWSRGYSHNQIVSIIASGALSSDVSGLEKKGYTRDEIVNYLDKGISPVALEQYKTQGYEPDEINKIVAVKVKAAEGKQQGSGGAGSTTPDIISIEIKFIIVSNGNVTPTWKLLRISANTGNTPLFNLGRTRTHDVIITIGPNNQTTANTHLASQIGNAVSNSNQAIFATPQSNSVLPLGF